MISGQPMTADKLLHMPHDGMRYELVRGRLVMMSPSGYAHGEIVARITFMIYGFVQEHGLGTVLGAETGFKLRHDPDTVCAPDMSFVALGNEPPHGETRRFPRTAPDLAVEVLSPTDRAGEVKDKISDYLEAGVRLIWVVDPKRRRVTEYRPGQEPVALTQSERLSGHDVLPGFSCEVLELFPKPTPKPKP